MKIYLIIFCNVFQLLHKEVVMNLHEKEVEQNNRFEFGKNWSKFLDKLDEERIFEAEISLKKMINIKSFKDKSFLDIGSGSGLFSLAARRLGANVHSFDYDPLSVKCTLELKDRYFPNDIKWNIEEASILDNNYIDKLGVYDIVYSWGVLHHTGSMYIAFENSIKCVARGGFLYIAIYNDQKWKSHLWWFIKLVYNKLPGLLGVIYAYLLTLALDIINIIKHTIKFEPIEAFKPLLNYKKKRGMSRMSDIIDWIGGFPYEFETFNNLKTYYEVRGFELVESKKASSLGCHEMVFRKI